jgi:hypothetical protein
VRSLRLALCRDVLLASLEHLMMCQPNGERTAGDLVDGQLFVAT